MDRAAYIYIGLAPVVILGMLADYKKLRSNKILKLLLLVTFLFGVIGLSIKNQGAVMFTAPFGYVISYAFFRYVYIKIYNVEPTYNKYSWYDAEDGRKQNWLDVITYVFPIFLSGIIPIALMIIKNKASN